MEKIKSLIEKIKSFIRMDGLQHICACALIMVALGWIRPLFIAVILVLAVAFGKEAYDYCKKKDSIQLDSIKKDAYHDMVCDCVGILIGLLFVFLNLLSA